MSDSPWYAAYALSRVRGAYHPPLDQQLAAIAASYISRFGVAPAALVVGPHEVLSTIPPHEVWIEVPPRAAPTHLTNQRDEPEESTVRNLHRSRRRTRR